jgi:ATP-dependent RNA helicase RhlE
VKRYLTDPVTHSVDSAQSPVGAMTHHVLHVGKDARIPVLVDLAAAPGRTIVFTRTKHGAKNVARQLNQKGVPAIELHGNLSQNARTRNLAAFSTGTATTLVATDIAARGIDVTALGHVVNFDVPAVPEDYIHRVGRTARAELTGSAFTFVAPEEETDLRAIEKAINSRLPRITVPDFDYHARPEARLEIPIAQRIAEIRARKGEERARAKAKLERRAAADRGGSGSGAPRPGGAAPASPSYGRPGGHRRTGSGGPWRGGSGGGRRTR